MPVFRRLSMGIVLGFLPLTILGQRQLVHVDSNATAVNPGFERKARNETWRSFKNGIWSTRKHFAFHRRRCRVLCDLAVAVALAAVRFWDRPSRRRSVAGLRMIAERGRV